MTHRWVFLLYMLFVLVCTMHAQNVASNEFWSDIDERGMINGGRQLPAERYRHVVLDVTSLEQLLSRAPMEFTEAARMSTVILPLPLPDGTMSRFLIAESPIMEPELAAQLHSTRTYCGQGIDLPAATTRFSWTLEGFRAIILLEKSAVFIVPYADGDKSRYISYYDRDFVGTRDDFKCVTDDLARPPSTPLSPLFATGEQLRTYRLAIAATGEFTLQYGGGIKINALVNAIIPLVNNINAIYERDATIRFSLVANMLSIVYDDWNNDPYDVSLGNASLLAQNQTNLDAVIGDANYDIGHVLYGIPVGPGAYAVSGLATVGVVCITGSKGRAVTGIGGGTGPEPIYVYGVGHEFGHQFGAGHTYNGTTGLCNFRNPPDAYEPGSGSTIMSYLSCGNENLEPGIPTYFHNGSITKILAHANGIGNCASLTPTGNSPPSIDPLTNHTIPQQTPFVLTASSTDPNGDPLTFTWEQYDLGTQSPPNTDDGTRPIFRSYSPSSSGNTRHFPSTTYVLNNANVPPQTYMVGSTTYTTGEALATTNRTLNFHVTARDNRAGGGGVQDGAMQVTVTALSGPFAVTAPNTNVSLDRRSCAAITWNVANTTELPVSCANVKISLSTDGGNTFPVILAASTPNDGIHEIEVPDIEVINQARIKIEAVGNIFYDISDHNFSIRNPVSLQQWIAVYNGPGNAEDTPQDIAVDVFGNVYVTGFAYDESYITGQCYTIKYNADGNQQWVALFRGRGDSGPRAMAIDDFGNVYVTGVTGSGPNTIYDFVTIKYNCAGIEQWVALYAGGSFYDEPSDIALDTEGNAYVTGYSMRGSPYGDYATIKYNTTGVEQWVARYNGPGNQDDGASAVAVDRYGNVYVTGSSKGNGTENDVATIKYNADGYEQWVARYNGPSNSGDYAYAMALDPSGGVFVTGASIQAPQARHDFLTVKYDSIGNQIWVATYNGTGNDNDYVGGIAVDQSGNAYVTGQSRGIGTDWDYATVKYSSSGLQEWVRRYVGPYSDVAVGIVVDLSGNVYVTGESSQDYLTLKYNTHGDFQWLERYDAGGEDIAYAMEVDALGSVYVTGLSLQLANFDCVTLKFPQMDPVPIQLASFSGRRIDTNSVLLEWTTISEINNYGFELQKSATQNGPFATISGSFVPGNGTTLEPRHYRWTDSNATRNEPFYRLKQIDLDGTTHYFDPIRVDPVATVTDKSIPVAFSLLQNYPNPFNPTTEISYQLPEASHVKLQVFDVIGREVATPVNEVQEAGFKSVKFDASNLSSGVYLYRLVAGEFVATKKFLLMK